jgi:hypothetical protein
MQHTSAATAQLSPFDRPPIRIIALKLCRMYFFPEGCVKTLFHDGRSFEGFPHNTPDYWEVAKRCGYHDFFARPGDNRAIEAFCQEHDFCHNFIAERLANSFSYVIHPLAHNTEVIQPLGMYEEAIILHFQRFLNTQERPIIEGPDWDLLKSQALLLLGMR